MSLANSIRSIFFRPKLRNKPGGLARVVNIETGDGAGACEGCIVTTVRADGDLWSIEPRLDYVMRVSRINYHGQLIAAGESATIIAIRDECLIPLKDPPADAQDESTVFYPAVPKTAPVRETA